MALKLTLHLVPETAYGKNLRAQLGTEWSRLSSKIRTANNKQCCYCGWRESRGKYTHLHELWEYDDKNHIQKLVGFECVCPDCHAVHHWGHSKFIGRDMDALLRHACEVNGCSEREFQEHLHASFRIWNERSAHEWKCDTSYYSAMNFRV